MQRNIVLLSIPPLIALAMLAYFDHAQQTPDLDSKPQKAFTEQHTPINQPATSQAAKVQTLTLKPVTGSQQDQISVTPISGIEQIRAIKNKTALHQAVLKDHASFTRYPSSNVRVDRLERDPVTMTYETHQRTTESEDMRTSITAWTDKKYINQGQALTLFSRIDSVELQGLSSKIMAQVYFSEQQSILIENLQARQQDGTYYLTISEEQTSLWPSGIYKAIIVSDIDQLSESVSFVISPPVISLTGEHRDRITDTGSLLVELEVNVEENARYYVRAALYSNTNDPIGSSQFSETLKPGRHWIPLEYFGLMIRDAGEPGPYNIYSVELAQAGVPMLRMPISKTNIYTYGYTLDQFSGQTYREQQEPVDSLKP
ncbi:hypothetical protein A3715_13210 [Oleiphilus sp. HI0009]|nr:hypothetical protein A3715_13210 [Oleiphilus sp. HI0009]